MDTTDPRWDSYYGILGVNVDSSDEEIRRAYRKLAMQWHPDKWTRSPSLLGEAKHKFQQIQEAYSVLSDQRKRAIYDAGLHHTLEDEDEDFSDFLMEMMSLMNQAKREGKSYSMEELQSMFTDMARVSSTQIGLIPHISNGLLSTSLPNGVKSPLRLMTPEIPIEVDARHIPWPEQTHIYACLISRCIEENHFASLSARSLGPQELGCCLFKEKSSNFKFLLGM
ncbi:hypothetical protein C3L33_17347, partial [Rhododendron williamsianum]